MYKSFYGFEEKPFSIVSDPSFLYLSRKHRCALSYLEYGLLEGIGFVLLTGEIGTGKTTLVKYLLDKIPEDTEIAVVFNTNVSSEQLLELILEEYELTPSRRGKAAALDCLNQFLLNRYSEGRRVLLIVDEAQNLSQEALEEVRMLSNLQTDKAALLQILLVGQPALRTRLRQPSLAQLSQRISVSYHLTPLDLEETTRYIAHRLKTAGRQGDALFTKEAVERVFERSGGTPRTINILCDSALVYGYADQRAEIGGQVIDEVLKDKEDDAGLWPASASGTEVVSYSGPPESGGELVARIERLERQVTELSVLFDRQAVTYEHRVEGYKDTLVERLEKLLAQERERTDRLLLRCSSLHQKLKLAQVAGAGPGSGEEEKPLGAGEADVSVAGCAADRETERDPWFRRILGSRKKL